MEALQYLAQGLGIALQPVNILFAFIGCLLGTLVGVLPGIGPISGVALLIPVTATSTERPNTPITGDRPPMEPIRMPAAAAAIPAAIHAKENTRGTLMPQE